MAGKRKSTGGDSSKGGKAAKTPSAPAVAECKCTELVVKWLLGLDIGYRTLSEFILIDV